MSGNRNGRKTSQLPGERQDRQYGSGWFRVQASSIYETVADSSVTLHIALGPVPMQEDESSGMLADLHAVREHRGSPQGAKT